MAGAPTKEQVYLEHGEINKTSNYLTTMLKLVSRPSSNNGSSSKIWKEFEKVVINGNNKVNLLVVGGSPFDDDLVREMRIPLMKVKKQKFNKRFIEVDVLMDLVQKEREIHLAKETKKRQDSSAKRSNHRRDTSPIQCVNVKIEEECSEQPESRIPSPEKQPENL